MTTIPIEHAWLTMATGLHIHVHFLEVWPRTQERRGRTLYNRYRESCSLPLPDTTRGGVGCKAHSHAFTSFC